ncbi:kinase-like protein, partial [Clavulina sp. PMI_390]
VSRGIAYLHSQQPPVIHGDLHPGNVLIDRSGVPLLCDFGLNRLRHNITRIHGIPEGESILFLAPELSTSPDERVQPTLASDIFSLSMTFFSTWTREKPFSGVRNKWEIASWIGQGRRPERMDPAISLLLEVESALWQLIETMWAQEPASRPSSGDVVQRLEQIFLLGKVSESYFLRSPPLLSILRY